MKVGDNFETMFLVFSSVESPHVDLWVTQKMFWVLRFLQTTVKLYQDLVTNQSSCGTPWESASTQFRFVIYQSIPKPPIPPRAIPGHLTHVKLRTAGEFDLKGGPPGGAFDFHVKASVSGRKQKDFAILLFSTCPTFTGHSTWAFLLLSLHYIVMSWNRP